MNKKIIRTKTSLKQYLVYENLIRDIGQSSYNDFEWENVQKTENSKQNPLDHFITKFLEENSFLFIFSIKNGDCEKNQYTVFFLYSG